MAANKAKYAFECDDSRYCFAQGPITGNCMILNGKMNQLTGEIMAPYEDGECPFCKPMQCMTKGVKYPVPRDLKLPREHRERKKKGA